MQDIPCSFKNQTTNFYFLCNIFLAVQSVPGGSLSGDNWLGPFQGQLSSTLVSTPRLGVLTKVENQAVCLVTKPQSQFPHSCVCERFTYSYDRSAYSAAGNKWTDPGNM